jgi:hypothetical protein
MKALALLLVAVLPGVVLAGRVQQSGQQSPVLPRVLLIGDSVYSAAYGGARGLLRGRVELFRPKIQVRGSAMALANCRELLGDGKWDLIHFNFGFEDFFYTDPRTKARRAMSKHAGGVRVTTPARYEANLRELVRLFKATGAKLIWASTTPIESSKFDSILDPASELEFNAIAKKVMVESGVTINDMHAYVTANIKNKRDPSPYWFDRYPLYPPIVRCMLAELDMTRPVDGPVKVFLMVGGSTHMGHGVVFGGERPRAGKNGTLDDLVLNSTTAESHRHLVDKDGRWRTRSDVWVQFDRRFVTSGAHGIKFGGDRKRGIGPEYGFGNVLGDHFDKQVFVFKSTLGNPSLVKDLRPPSSGKTGRDYQKFVDQVHDAVGRMENQFPDYTNDAGHEVCGLVINLGEADEDAKMYANYLPMLIDDLRKELKVPELPVIIVATGQGGRQTPAYPDIVKAQQSVAGLRRFQGNVCYIETRDYWPSKSNSPEVYPEKWYGNAESFYKIGHAIGEGMLSLLR